MAVFSPGAQSKTTYEAPRFQANRLRPEGSRTRHASSSARATAGRTARERRCSSEGRRPRGCPPPGTRRRPAGRSPRPPSRRRSTPRRSPSPRCSGLAAKTTTSASTGRTARARGEAGCQTTARIASATSTPTITTTQAGSSGSASRSSSRRGSSRPPRARPTRPRPACGATAERHTTPSARTRTRSSPTGPRPAPCARAGRASSGRATRRTRASRRPATSPSGRPRPPAAAAGARTRPTSLQRTPSAIATAGIARTKYPVASSEAFVPTISGGAWRIHRCGAPKRRSSPTSSPRLRRLPGYTVCSITSSAPDWATRTTASAAPASTVPPSEARARRRRSEVSSQASVGTRTVAVSGIVQGA